MDVRPRSGGDVGAGFALAGAALFYQSIPLLAYAVLFLVLTHAFVVLYEEPTLRRAFGGDYDAYCRRTGRWGPHWRPPNRGEPTDG